MSAYQDFPKSPWTAWLAKFQYWTQSGWSRPRSFRWRSYSSFPAFSGQEEQDRVADHVEDGEDEEGDPDDDDDQLDELAGDVGRASGRRSGEPAGGAGRRPAPERRYFLRGVARNMRSISSLGASYSMRLLTRPTRRGAPT